MKIKYFIITYIHLHVIVIICGCAHMCVYIYLDILNGIFVFNYIDHIICETWKKLLENNMRERKEESRVSRDSIFFWSKK